MQNLCYINGKILKAKEAVIGINDLALQRGCGVFDYLRTYNGKLFHFYDHIARLKKSASMLRLNLPVPDHEILKIAEQFVKESGRLRMAVRIILTCGFADKNPLLSEPNIIIVAEDLPGYPEEIYISGVKIITVNFQREFPKIKSLNYLNEFLIEPLKIEKNAFDMLYHSELGITECPRSNFFVFKDGNLITPSENILHGITRNIVLQLAKDHFEIDERTISLSEIKNIDEAFITSTTKGIIPVIQIDDLKIGDTMPGINTKRMMKLFNDYTNKY